MTALNTAIGGDVLLVQTDDGGDLSLRPGRVEMTTGFHTMAYLCLAGGNEDDDGRPGNKKSWWGNLLLDPDSQLRSETQYLLGGLPATSGNLRRLETAANRDFAVFRRANIADTVDVSAELIGRGTVEFNVSISANGEESRFSFVENWRGVDSI